MNKNLRTSNTHNQIPLINNSNTTNKRNNLLNPNPANNNQIKSNKQSNNTEYSKINVYIYKVYPGYNKNSKEREIQYKFHPIKQKQTTLNNNENTMIQPEIYNQIKVNNSSDLKQYKLPNKILETLSEYENLNEKKRKERLNGYIFSNDIIENNTIQVKKNPYLVGGFIKYFSSKPISKPISKELSKPISKQISKPISNPKSIKIYNNGSNLEKLYQEIYLKLPTRMNLNSFEKTESLSKIYKDFEINLHEVYEKLKNYYEKLNLNKIFINKEKNYEKKYPRYYYPSFDYLYHSEIIYKINTSINEKIIVIGDLHGSFHSFFRIFTRLFFQGIIKNDYTLLDDYRLIFLGDVVDRGIFGIEILYIIVKCMNKNNTNDKLRVILIRGNHEHKTTHLNFSKEIEKKYFEEEIKYFEEEIKYFEEKIKYFKEEKKNIEEEIKYFKEEIETLKKDNLKKNLNDFKMLFMYCPSAIYLNHKKTNYWLCHGGFKPDYNNTNNNVEFYSDYETDIRWNDFSSTIGTYDSYQRKLALGLNDLTKFLGNNNLDFIIRGHTDSHSNAMLLQSYEELSNKKKHKHQFFYINNKSSYEEYKDEIHNNECIKYNDVSKFNKTKDSIAEIYPKKFYNKSLYQKKDYFNYRNGINPIQSLIPLDNEKYTLFPVLTISNNCDNGRGLHPDCYVMIT
jgi:hypothetical protein